MLNHSLVFTRHASACGHSADTHRFGAPAAQLGPENVCAGGVLCMCVYVGGEGEKGADRQKCKGVFRLNPNLKCCRFQQSVRGTVVTLKRGE